MADVSYQNSGDEFSKMRRSASQDPWYVRALVQSGFVKNKTQAAYVLLALAIAALLCAFVAWPEGNYAGPDPSGEIDPVLQR